MLTIRAMVEFGPWMFEEIEELDSRSESCQRCGTSIKYVWICRLTTTGEAWRIGSKCAPILLEVSEAVWGERTKRFDKMLKTLLRLRKLEARLADRPSLEPEDGWLNAQLARIETGDLTERELKVLNWRCSQIEKLDRLSS